MGAESTPTLEGGVEGGGLRRSLTTIQLPQHGSSAKKCRITKRKTTEVQ